jgi:hypothetical protein
MTSEELHDGEDDWRGELYDELYPRFKGGGSGIPNLDALVSSMTNRNTSLTNQPGLPGLSASIYADANKFSRVTANSFKARPSSHHQEIACTAPGCNWSGSPAEAIVHETVCVRLVIEEALARERETWATERRVLERRCEALEATVKALQGELHRTVGQSKAAASVAPWPRATPAPVNAREEGIAVEVAEDESDTGDAVVPVDLALGHPRYTTGGSYSSFGSPSSRSSGSSATQAVWEPIPEAIQCTGALKAHTHHVNAVAIGDPNPNPNPNAQCWPAR